MPRRPTPTALRVLQGNASHRPLNRREPNVEVKIPPAPAFLDKRAKEEWRRVGRQLFAARMISVLDRASLAGYCSAVSRFEAAEVELQEIEAKMKNPPADEKQSGQLVYRLNLATGKRKQALHEVRTLGIEFGLTPSARSKMRIEDLQGELDFTEAGDSLEKIRQQLTGGETALQRSQRLAGA